VADPLAEAAEEMAAAQSAEAEPALAVDSAFRTSAPQLSPQVDEYELSPPEVPERPRTSSTPVRPRDENPPEATQSFFCFPLLAVVTVTLVSMMCLCPLAMFLEFPKGLMMLWGIVLIFGGIGWFAYRFKKFTGEHMTDEAPWYLRGGLAVFLQLTGYVIQEPIVFGPPFSVFVLGFLLCISSIFIPDMRPYLRRNPAVVMPPPAPVGQPAPPAVDVVKTEPSAAAKPTPTLKELLAGGPTVYLTDLEEFDVQAGACPIGKNGELGNGSRIVVQGKESKKGLGMHPPQPPAVAKASYRLGKQRAILRGGAALNDTADSPWGAAIFIIRADGQELWKSPPLKSRGQVKEFQLDLNGVDVLEFSVIAEGHNHYVHAVWVEPRLTTK